MTAAAQHSRAGVVVDVLVGPLPYVAHQIEHAEGACRSGVRVYIARGLHITPEVGEGNIAGGDDDLHTFGTGLGLTGPQVSPRIHPAVGTLRSVLPLPLVRQAFACPLRVGACIFDRDPGNRLVVPACRVRSIGPVLEKVVIVCGVVVSRIEKTLELAVGHRVLVHPERCDVQLVLVIAACRVLPWVLEVDAFVVHAFNLDAVDAEDIVGCRDLNHAFGG